MSYFTNFKKCLFIINKKFVNLAPYILLSIILACVDILGLGIVYPYVSIIVDPQSEISQKVMIFFDNYLPILSNYNIIIVLSCLVLLAFILKNSLNFILTAIIYRFAVKEISFLRPKLMSLYQNMDYLNYIKRKQVEYLRNINELTKSCLDSVEYYLRIITDVIIVTILFTYMLWFNPKVLLFFLAMILSVMFPLFFILKKRTVKYGNEYVSGLEQLYKNVSEAISGFKEIKVINREKFFLEKISDTANRLYKSSFLSHLNNIIIPPVIEVALILFVVSFVAIATVFKSTATEIIPVLSVFALVAIRTIPLCQRIVRNSNRINYYQKSVEIIYNDIYNLSGNEKSLKKLKNSFSFEKVEFKNIYFKYPAATNSVFDNLNFSMKKNECIGIIGESGSGKTTLIDLLLGLLKPQKGEIVINDKSSLNLDFDLSSLAAYLPQEPLLLESSIEENVTLQINKTLINRDEFKLSLKNSNIDDFVNSLPNREKTVIGDKGLRLSGGQAQRITLARIFYHAKDIIIMDEATSSLDRQTEDEIIENLNSYKGKKTIVVITHKKETLKYVDKVFQIKNKNLVKLDI